MSKKKEHPAITELRSIIGISDDPFAPALSRARLREGQLNAWVERWLTSGAGEVQIMKSHGSNAATKADYLNRVRQHAALQAMQDGCAVVLERNDTTFEYYQSYMVALRATPKERG